MFLPYIFLILFFFLIFFLTSFNHQLHSLWLRSTQSPRTSRRHRYPSSRAGIFADAEEQVPKAVPASHAARERAAAFPTRARHVCVSGASQQVSPLLIVSRRVFLEPPDVNWWSDYLGVGVQKRWTSMGITQTPVGGSWKGLGKIPTVTSNRTVRGDVRGSVKNINHIDEKCEKRPHVEGFFCCCTHSHPTDLFLWPSCGYILVPSLIIIFRCKSILELFPKSLRWFQSNVKDFDSPELQDVWTLTSSACLARHWRVTERGK